jgi:hypothetical protein
VALRVGVGGLPVQDVWIVPHGRAAGTERGAVEYGTAVRVYDPDTDRWVVSWITRVFGDRSPRAVPPEVEPFPGEPAFGLA